MGWGGLHPAWSQAEPVQGPGLRHQRSRGEPRGSTSIPSPGTSLPPLGAGGAAWEGGLFPGPSCPARTAATLTRPTGARGKGQIPQRNRFCRLCPLAELRRGWPRARVPLRKGREWTHRAGPGPPGMPGTRPAQIGPQAGSCRPRGQRGPSRRLWLKGRERRTRPAPPSAPEAHLPREL